MRRDCSCLIPWPPLVTWRVGDAAVLMPALSGRRCAVARTEDTWPQMCGGVLPMPALSGRRCAVAWKEDTWPQMCGGVLPMPVLSGRRCAVATTEDTWPQMCGGVLPIDARLVWPQMCGGKDGRHLAADVRWCVADVDLQWVCGKNW